MTLHADDNAVSLLSIAMTTKLRKMRAKGRSGWDSESCTQQHLSNLLRAAVEKGDTVDVANYCAFLLARVESILPAEQPKPVASGGWMERLGFELRQHDDMLRIVVDDCGNEREATLTERVLWDALMTANAEFAEAPQAPAAPVDDLAQLVKQLVRALRKAAPGNDLADKALDYLKRQGLQGSPLRTAHEAPPTHVGLLAAAAHIQAKAQAHLDERGSYDPDTGAVEMSESNQEHFNTLDELAEEIRLMADKAAPAPCGKPPQAPATEPVARAIFTNRNKPDVEWLVESVTRGMLLYAAPQAPAAPEDPMDWPLPCDVTVGHGTIRKGCKLRTLVLRMQVLYQLAQETELAAPAAPAVDASPLLAPETELDAVVRDAAQIIRDAEHYRFIKRHRLILSGGTDTFGWPIAPFGDECDRYIAQELATERAAQAKEGGEAA